MAVVHLAWKSVKHSAAALQSWWMEHSNALAAFSI